MALCGLPASDTGTCRWIEGDALDLPFADCYFDAVTVGYGLRNVVDKSKAMREIYRVLKPGSVQVKIWFKFCFVSNLDKFSELGFYWTTGSRASILDFNKSSSLFTTSLQVKCQPILRVLFEVGVHMSLTCVQFPWQRPILHY